MKLVPAGAVATTGLHVRTSLRTLVRSPYVVLFLLLAANYLWLRYLYESDLYLVDYFSYRYPQAASTSWWEYFVPARAYSGWYAPLGALFTQYCPSFIGAANLWYLVHALLLLVSFFASWAVLRSRVFTYSLCICLAFGTQLYHTYIVAGSLFLPLLLAVFEIVLLCGYRVLCDKAHPLGWRVAFGVAAIIGILLGGVWWLDFFVCLVLASVFLGMYLWRTGRRQEMSRLVFIAATITVLSCLYVYVKLSYVPPIRIEPGAEEDVIFNYPSIVPMAEDMLSNVFTYLYLTVSNFLPPFLVTSNSLSAMGSEGLSELQLSYNPKYARLIPMQHVFLWRFYAGAWLAACGYLLLKMILRAWRRGAVQDAALGFLMVMSFVPSATHVFIKARPYMSMPALTYKAIIGILGLSLLVSFVLMLARRGWPRLRSTLLVACVWGVIVLGGLTRPVYLSQMSIAVGVGGAGPGPDPLAVLRDIVRPPDCATRIGTAALDPSAMTRRQALGLVNSGCLDGYQQIALPSRWRAADTADTANLAEVAPPLTVSGQRGDYSFSRRNDQGGDVIRITPISTTIASTEMALQFGLSLADDAGRLRVVPPVAAGEVATDFEISTGDMLVLSIWARLAGTNAVLFIKDRTDEWQRAATLMRSTDWRQYVVAKQIRAGADSVLIGIIWEPDAVDAWLEIRDMRADAVPVRSTSQP
jgi:hypothetical protein